MDIKFLKIGDRGIQDRRSGNWRSEIGDRGIEVRLSGKTFVAKVETSVRALERPKRDRCKGVRGGPSASRPPPPPLCAIERSTLCGNATA